MKSSSIGVCLLLILLLTISVGTTITKPVNAQTIDKPAAPEFSLQSYNPYYFEFIANNQLFAPHKDANGNNITLSYNFRFKAHAGDNWYYYPEEILPNKTIYHTILLASNSSSTVVIVPQSSHGLSSIPIGYQVDFQVQALIGSYSKDIWNDTIFTGEYSEWSSTLTTTIPPLPTPSVPEFSWLIILPLLLTIPIALAIVRKRLQRNV